MQLFFIVLLATLGVIVVRVYFKLRTAQRSRAETWDEHMISQLRAQGYVPFNSYKVDFFLSLPDETACQRARARLEPEFEVDTKPLKEESGFSLHATKSMRLLVPDMQELSRRLGALASELGGRYDGWAA